MTNDEAFLWEMLFYASHSNEEPDTRLEDIRENPDLVGYIVGWRHAGCVGVVAEENNIPVGAAWLRLLSDGEQWNPVFVEPGIPELAVAVVPGREGEGIGTDLIARLLEDAKGRFPAIVLSSRSENPAVRLYERLGFGIIEEITNRVGTPSVKMIINL